MGKIEKKKSAKKKKPLTIRERKFIKALMAGVRPTQAMRDAGYAETTARTRQGIKLAETRETIQALMEKKGLTDDKLLEVLNDGLKCDKVISANVIAPNGEGMADAHSMTKDFIEVPDHPTRHKYLDTALKLKGHMIEKKELSGPNGGAIATSIEVVFIEAVDGE